jgi:RNA polymerase sigma factor (sigma-70 family)
VNATSIEQLVEAARCGDAVAINALLHHYQPDLARFARTVCATPEDAEDAVQEALWIASQKIGTLRVAASFTSWIFRVIKNECYRLLRRGRREAPLRAAAAAQYIHEQAHLQVSLAGDLVKAIASLEPIYRQVLIMRDMQEMTAPQVAALLGVTVDAVKSRLHRARTQLRVMLKDWVE